MGPNVVFTFLGGKNLKWLKYPFTLCYYKKWVFAFFGEFLGFSDPNYNAMFSNFLPLQLDVNEFKMAF